MDYEIVWGEPDTEEEDSEPQIGYAEPYDFSDC